MWSVRRLPEPLTLVFTCVCLLWLSTLRSRLDIRIRAGLHALMAAALLQVSLGISTLLLHVPVPLAATHQAGAVLLLSVLIYLNQRMAQETE